MTSTHTHTAAARAGAPLLLNGLARNWWKVLLRGAAAIAFGVLAFIWPGATILALTLLWGAYALIDGVLSLWAAVTGGGAAAPRWWLAIVGVAGVAAGLVTFFWPGVATFALLMVIAAWAMVVGVMEIVGAVRLRKEIEGEWMLALGGILSIVFGLLIAFQPTVGAVGAVWALGAVAIATGVTLVALSLKLRKHNVA
ncbi:MAG: HdeD family acid-resistance protein [Vitreimonas sp.]